MLFYLADRPGPGCDAQLQVLGPNCGTTIWFGHAAALANITISSSIHCFWAWIEHCHSQTPIPVCANCMGLDFYNHSKSNQYAKILQGYPTTHGTNVAYFIAHTMHKVYLKLHRMTFDLLICGLYVKQRWKSNLV